MNKTNAVKYMVKKHNTLYSSIRCVVSIQGNDKISRFVDTARFMERAVSTDLEMLSHAPNFIMGKNT